jgi:hypothetical protein
LTVTARQIVVHGSPTTISVAGVSVCHYEIASFFLRRQNIVAPEATPAAGRQGGAGRGGRADERIRTADPFITR